MATAAALFLALGLAVMVPVSAQAAADPYDTGVTVNPLEAASAGPGASRVAGGETDRHLPQLTSG